ncbi:hypothetical protein GJ496_006416 [Pomphorhynchus laevis]|nr:hypothetical protein GJ496_006416 [Pomphorhynchus laevis]
MHTASIYFLVLITPLITIKDDDSDFTITSDPNVDSDDFDGFPEEIKIKPTKPLPEKKISSATDDHSNDKFIVEEDEHVRADAIKENVRIIDLSDNQDNGLDPFKGYHWETFIVFICASYITIYVIGKLKNEAVAEYWYRQCFRQFLQEFALIGNYQNDSSIEEIDNNVIEHRKLQIQKENDCLFRLWLSGRKSIKNGLLIELHLSRRFCALQLLLNLGRKYSMTDYCSFTIELDNMDTFVLLVCCSQRANRRKIVAKRAADYPDISQFGVERKAAKYKSFTTAYSELTEPLDMLDSDARLRSAVEDNMVRLIHISDRYTGIKSDEDTTALPSTDHKSILYIEFNLSVDDIRCFDFALYLADKLTQFKLSRESKQRAINNRQAADEQVQKVVSRQRQEMARQKRDEKRKELSENDPEQLRRLNEKQNKKEIPRYLAAWRNTTYSTAARDLYRQISVALMQGNLKALHKSLPENEDYFNQMPSQDPKVQWTSGQGSEIISPSFVRLINEQREIGELSTEEAMPDMFTPMAISDETNYTNDDLDAVYSGAHSLSLTRMMSKTKNYADYFIIGKGASSISANDSNSKILMVSRDTTLPFHRSMLRRNMGECTVEQLNTTKFKRASDKEIRFHTVGEDAFTPESPSSSAITLLKNRKSTRIDIKQSVTTLDDGWKVTFDEALSATGTAVYVPEYLSDIIGSDRLFERVIRLQSTDDLNKAKTLIDKNEVRFIAIIGSKIESVELARTLAFKYPDIKIKLICYHKKGIVGQKLPSWFVQRCRQAHESVDI